MMVEILASDEGFGWVKAMTPRGRVLLPSLVGTAETIRFNTEISENGQGIALEVNGKRIFVGEQAERQSATVQQTLNSMRIGSVEQLALFHGVCSELVRPSDDEIAVVTGLSVADFTPANKEKVRKILQGEHCVRRTGRHDRQFKVTHVYVVPQSLGSLYFLVLDRQGRLSDSDLANSQVGVIDIGTLTTNYILCDHLHYIETGSDSIQVGVSVALRKLAKELRDNYGLDWTQRLHKVDQAARRGWVEVQGRSVDISPLAQSHFEAIGETIRSHAGTLWGAGGELKAVVVTGGGSIRLATFLAQRYPHLRTVGDDPQFANVTGFLRIGLRRFGTVP